MIPNYRRILPAILLMVALGGGTASAQDQNAFLTRQQLTELLRQYPPAIGQVLRLDPSLLNSKDYLAPYPALAAFLSKHTEIAHDPRFFLSEVNLIDQEFAERREYRRDNQTAREVAQFTAVFLIVLTIAGALIWGVKSVIEYRRWLRMTRTQNEIHSKLMDRFTASEDLLTYIQTPAGKRFLESAPVVIDPGLPANAPVGRILWSVQVGLVLALGGLGMNYAGRYLQNEASQPLFVLGVLGVALGIGFVLSAFTSYLISRRMGLIQGPAEPPPS